MFVLACLVHALSGVHFTEAGTCYACWFGEMGHKHNLHFGWHTQWVSHSKTPGQVQLGFAVKVFVLCWGFKTNKNFSFSNGGVFIVCGFCHSALQFLKCAHEWSVDTHCVHAYAKLTFHLHHAWHSCLVFTALWCGCSVVKLIFYLHQAPC